MSAGSTVGVLDGRIALVTGGAGGIGAAIARAMAGAGARVAVVDSRLPAAALVADGIAGGSCAFEADVREPGSVLAAVQAVMREFGRIDVLVNCAGVALLAPAETMCLRSWDTTLDVNLRGAFLTAQAVGRHMLAAGRGKIINIASTAATVGMAEHAAYCASKAGLLGLTRALAVEWGPHGLTVNAVSPTAVLTDLSRNVLRGDDGEAFIRLIPSGRFVEPEEVAALVTFIASDAADMMNGADVVLDGGYTSR